MRVAQRRFTPSVFHSITPNEEQPVTPTYDTAVFLSANDLRLRAQAEFLEMPGLQLTLAQASRLFSLDRHVCARLLDALVEAGFLRRTGESYARADTGRRCA